MSQIEFITVENIKNMELKYQISDIAGSLLSIFCKKPYNYDAIYFHLILKPFRDFLV